MLQPGEFAKFAAVLAVAAVLSRRDVRTGVALRRIVAVALLGALPAGLLVLQPDLGNAVLLLGLSGLLLFVAGMDLRLLAAPALVGGVGVAVYVASHDYAWGRVVGFLHPWKTAHEQGYQLVQSFVAFGRGGLLGTGVGGGLQKLHYLPEAHTDFILAVIAEELGLAGVLVVLGAFAALLFAGVRLALRTRQRFAMLLAFGMTALLVVPAVMNCAVVMGLVPTKGLTLAAPLLRPLVGAGLVPLPRRAARHRAPRGALGGGADRQGLAARGGAVTGPALRVPLRWAIAGGGSGGHVTPALALGQAARAAGEACLFFGARRGHGDAPRARGRLRARRAPRPAPRGPRAPGARRGAGAPSPRAPCSPRPRCCASRPTP